MDELGQCVRQPDLTLLVSRFLHGQAFPESDIPANQDLAPCPTVQKLRIFHSASATFYAPSDPSGIGGMHRERIRAAPSWRSGPARFDCVFIGKDASQPGLRGLHVGRVRLFFSFEVPVHAMEDELTSTSFACALVEWFSPISDEPDEETGMWIVKPDFNIYGRRAADVVHIDSLLRAAHLIGVCGSEALPKSLHHSDSLDAFQAFYVNKYADHNSHEIAF